jgi:hypothetical protein
MNIQFRMTVEEYKAYCLSFFSQFNKEEINKQISEMSIPEFQAWFQKIGEEYYEYYSPVKELVAIIRGDYDPLKDYDSDKEDPLHTDEAQAFLTPFRETHNEVYQEFFNSLPAYAQKMEDLEKFHDEQEQERLLNIEVDGKHFKALKVIDVYWSGWECDQYAWLVKDGEEIRLVISDHGHKHFTDKAFLEGKIAEYKKAISETEDMLAMIK